MESALAGFNARTGWGLIGREVVSSHSRACRCGHQFNAPGEMYYAGNLDDGTYIKFCEPCMAKELSGSQLAFEKALTADSFDKAKLKALRDGFSEKRFKANEEAFLQFEAFLETLNLEQRKQMFELGKRSPNALLFL